MTKEKKKSLGPGTRFRWKKKDLARKTSHIEQGANLLLRNQLNSNKKMAFCFTWLFMNLDHHCQGNVLLHVFSCILWIDRRTIIKGKAKKKVV